MRISFGGGPRRGGHHFGPSISFHLGPMGSAIGCLITAIIGVFVTLFSLIAFNVMLLLIGVLFIFIGIIGYRSNMRIVKSRKNRDEE